MGNYENQDLDFVLRTKEILFQYDNYQIDRNSKYEVTLLLNCFVGLLILPQQRLMDELPQTIVSREEWGIAPDEIETIINGRRVIEEKSIRNVAKHLRNSISHYRFSAVPNTLEELHEFHFFDRLMDGVTISFELTITIANLRKFVHKLSDFYIEIMQA